MKAILAMDIEGGIGKGNDIPWHSKIDFAHFKEKTAGGVVVMGRKTFESLGCKPLPNRVNIVITRNPPKEEVDEVTYLVSKQALFNYMGQTCNASEVERGVWIIGGSEIYNLFEGHIDTYELTIVSRYEGESKIPQGFDCDTFFQPDLKEFKVTASSVKTEEKSNNSRLALSFSTWKRKTS